MVIAPSHGTHAVSHCHVAGSRNARLTETALGLQSEGSGTGSENGKLPDFIGRTPEGSYCPRGRSRHLLEARFSEPLLRILLRTLFLLQNL